MVATSSDSQNFDIVGHVNVSNGLQSKLLEQDFYVYNLEVLPIFFHAVYFKPCFLPLPLLVVVNGQAVFKAMNLEIV